MGTFKCIMEINNSKMLSYCVLTVRQVHYLIYFASQTDEAEVIPILYRKKLRLGKDK